MTKPINGEEATLQTPQKSAVAIYDLLCQLPTDLLSVPDGHPTDPHRRHEIEASGDQPDPAVAADQTIGRFGDEQTTQHTGQTHGHRLHGGVER